MHKQDQTRSKGIPLWLFFGSTYGLSWLIWGLVIASGRNASPLYILAGAIVPSLMGIVFIQLDLNRENRRGFWKRAIDFKRIGPGWYGVIVFLFPVILTVTFLVKNLFGGPSLSLGTVQRALSNPLQLVALIVMTFLVGPLSEELGWRGYALDRLQSRWNALTSSILLGLIWGGWHLPLFFMKGTVQAAMGLGLAFWLFILDAVLLSILFSWVYNNTSRSTLSALLLHWAYNFCTNLAIQMVGSAPLQILVIKAIVSLIICIVVVAVWGAQTMTGRSNSTQPSGQETSHA